VRSIFNFTFYKRVFWLFILIYGLLYVPVIFSQGTEDAPIILENFRHPQYGDKNPEVPEMMIYGAKAKTIGVLTYLDDLRIEFFDGAIEKIKAVIKTPYGVYDRSTKIIKGDKEIRLDSDKMIVEGSGFMADSQKKVIYIKSNVKVILTGDLKSSEEEISKK